MLRDFSTWWFEQMREMVPASIRFRPATRSGLIAQLDRAGSGLTLSYRARRGSTEFGRYTFDDGDLGDAVARLPSADRQVTLEVPARHVLQHRVVLPLAAELDLRALFAFELDRFTPFRADQVYWSAAVERRDVKAGGCMFACCWRLTGGCSRQSRR